MAQKDYKLEIVDLLLKGNDHARNMAKKLGTNHMIVSRKLKELWEENVVGFILNGRNKTYFLKKSPESKSFVAISEHYKLVQLTNDHPSIRDVIYQIQNDSDISLAFVCGKIKNEINIFVETENKKIIKRYSTINSNLIFTSGKIEENFAQKEEIVTSHIIIKGVEEFYDKIN